MHRSSYLRMECLIKYYEPYFGKEKEEVNVLDIGSYDMNGSYRDIFTDPRYRYTGLDMGAGPNVDLVPEDIYHWTEIADGSYDLVISGQVFEHIEYPWLTIREIARILRSSGFCIIIAPNSGMEHKAPKDCYRYHADGLAALAKWAGLKVHHVSVAGVPEKTGEIKDWINDWNDGCLVAQKEPAEADVGRGPFVTEKRVPTGGYAEVHRLWEIAVAQACKRFAVRKPFVLFGAGVIGGIVLEILGAQNVAFFVDNSRDKIGKEYQGKKVVAFEEYLRQSDRYNCLITVACYHAPTIQRQMDKAGARYGSLYSGS